MQIKPSHQILALPAPCWSGSLSGAGLFALAAARQGASIHARLSHSASAFRSCWLEAAAVMGSLRNVRGRTGAWSPGHWARGCPAGGGQGLAVLDGTGER